MALANAEICPQIRIQPGLSPALRGAAAELYWAAFGTKLGRVMGPSAKALAFIDRVISPGHVFSAQDDHGRLVGVIGFRTERGSFVGGGAEDLRCVYGRFGGAWRRHLLGVLAHDLPVRTVAIDGLAVAAPARSIGIGRALIEALADDARARGYQRLRLDVVGQNLRARALYERLGFHVVARTESRITGALYGFRTTYTMERPL